MKKVLCIGQSAYDITLPVEEFPIENRKVKIGNSKIECGGGSSNNVAYLLGLWGGNNVYLASSTGNDIYADKIVKELKSVNVSTKYFKVIDGVETTTSYIICNVNKGTRTIITNRDPNLKYPKDYKINLKPDYIFLDGNDPELSKRILKQNPQAISVIDAGGMKEGTPELCKLVDYVVCSNDFARDYTGITFDYHDVKTLTKVIEKMEKDFDAKVVITLEAAGCFTKLGTEYRIIPTTPNKATDSTGAGDIFHGAFLYFLIRGDNLFDIVKYANIAGGLSTMKIGSKNSIPTLNEVLKYKL